MQTAESTSAVEMVKAALLARDEALQKAREDMAAMQVVAAEREIALASAQDQLQQGPHHPQGGAVLVEPGRGEGQGGRAAEGQPGGQGRLAFHGGGAAPAGAERTPAGGNSALAGAVRP
jgi:hypothetical protein